MSISTVLNQIKNVNRDFHVNPSAPININLSEGSMLPNQNEGISEIKSEIRDLRTTIDNNLFGINLQLNQMRNVSGAQSDIQNVQQLSGSTIASDIASMREDINSMARRSDSSSTAVKENDQGFSWMNALNVAGSVATIGTLLSKFVDLNAVFKDIKNSIGGIIENLTNEGSGGLLGGLKEMIRKSFSDFFSELKSDLENFKIQPYIENFKKELEKFSIKDILSSPIKSIENSLSEISGIDFTGTLSNVRDEISRINFKEDVFKPMFDSLNKVFIELFDVDLKRSLKSFVQIIDNTSEIMKKSLVSFGKILDDISLKIYEITNPIDNMMYNRNRSISQDPFYPDFVRNSAMGRMEEMRRSGDAPPERRFEKEAANLLYSTPSAMSPAQRERWAAKNPELAGGFSTPAPTGTPAPAGNLTPGTSSKNLSRYTSGNADISKLNPDFAEKLAAFLDSARAENKQIRIFSAYRSPEHQKELFDKAVKKYGSEAKARKWVAPPGKSNHNKGLAADLRFLSSGSKEWAHSNANKFGLVFRMSYEPWHIEPINASSMSDGVEERGIFGHEASSPENEPETANREGGLLASASLFLGSVIKPALAFDERSQMTPGVFGVDNDTAQRTPQLETSNTPVGTAVPESATSPDSKKPLSAFGPVNQEFADAINRISKKYDLDPKELASVIASESGFNPKASNEKSKAAGLIQFMPSTAKDLGTTTEKILKMSAAEQMELVDKFFSKNNLPRGADAATIYATIVAPARKNEEILYKKGTGSYEQNIGLDVDKSGDISKSDLNKTLYAKGKEYNVPGMGGGIFNKLAGAVESGINTIAKLISGTANAAGTETDQGSEFSIQNTIKEGIKFAEGTDIKGALSELYGKTVGFLGEGYDKTKNYLTKENQDKIKSLRDKAEELRKSGDTKRAEIYENAANRLEKRKEEGSFNLNDALQTGLTGSMLGSLGKDISEGIEGFSSFKELYSGDSKESERFRKEIAKIVSSDKAEPLIDKGKELMAAGKTKLAELWESLSNQYEMFKKNPSESIKKLKETAKNLFDKGEKEAAEIYNQFIQKLEEFKSSGTAEKIKDKAVNFITGDSYKTIQEAFGSVGGALSSMMEGTEDFTKAVQGNFLSLPTSTLPKGAENATGNAPIINMIAGQNQTAPQAPVVVSGGGGGSSSNPEYAIRNEDPAFLKILYADYNTGVSSLLG